MSDGPVPSTVPGAVSAAPTVAGGGQWLREQLGPEDAVILIVDDEPSIIEIVQLYLEDAGYRRFVTTTDPTQALRLVEESSPDAVLLDVIMPGVNGLQILADIRSAARPSPVPVLILTSATDSETKQQALELGASDFLAKPVDPSELLLRLRNVLAAKAFQDRLAYVDDATGLPNRRHFVERLQRTVTRMQRSDRMCALLHIGIDRFQKVNDALGYRETEALLRAVAERIDANLRPDDVLAGDTGHRQSNALSRLESDEFIVLLSDLKSIEVVPSIAQRVLDALDRPINFSGHDLRLSASVGVVFSPLDGNEADTLMTHASRAMHYARESGGSSVQFYSEEIQSWSQERMKLEADLRHAISSDAFNLHYQPKIDLQTGRIYGVEALMRWTHPERGPVSPTVFIPAAEEAGLIDVMGAWALREACARAASWSSAGLADLSVAVNVSARQLDGDDLSKAVRRALSESALPPQRLTLELTEGMIMSDPDHSVEVLKALKDLGVRLSVDDFGTGYSSLAYLKRLPIDELKIDRSFVMDIPQDEDDMAIIAAVVALAKSLGLYLVAEGIETEAQYEFLAEQRCDAGQGYMFARPMTEQSIVELLGGQREFPRLVRPNAA